MTSERGRRENRRGEAPRPKKDPRIDAYISKAAPFARPILEHLRQLVHSTCPDVEETWKWSFPHFMYKGMLCSMASFKQHAAFGFWKASLVLGGGAKDVDAMGHFGRLTTVEDLPSKKTLIAYVKKAAAQANAEVKWIPPEVADAIVKACDEILAGKLHDQFVIDMMQGGAGTSTNMNANEVIANRGLELMGHVKGDYKHLHPNDHVNCSQSTNDAYPTAIKLAVIFSLKDTLAAMAELRDALAAKEKEFAAVLKMGRTENQDAVPMTLG